MKYRRHWEKCSNEKQALYNHIHSELWWGICVKNKPYFKLLSGEQCGAAVPHSGAHHMCGGASSLYGCIIIVWVHHHCMVVHFIIMWWSIVIVWWFIISWCIIVWWWCIIIVWWWCIIVWWWFIIIMWCFIASLHGGCDSPSIIIVWWSIIIIHCVVGHHRCIYGCYWVVYHHPLFIFHFSA